jgi:hypothetical protein
VVKKKKRPGRGLNYLQQGPRSAINQFLIAKTGWEREAWWHDAGDVKTLRKFEKALTKTGQNQGKNFSSVTTNSTPKAEG